jgi:hypothetical protein
MIKDRTIVPGEIEGFLSGCPFCTSLRIGIPETGKRFRVISGVQRGSIGTVVEWPPNIPKIENAFMAQLDCDSPDCQTSILIKWQMIQLYPFAPTPEWAPPLSMEDASELDKAITDFCEKSFANGIWEIDWEFFNEVIRSVWKNRLPLEPNELWPVLEAHGVPQGSKKDIMEFYERGRNLLVQVVGRKPIKKKKVAPLSL